MEARVLDLDHCYRALCARDARFDGLFFVGVSTTGIYCRPICPARTPRQERCDFFRTAAPDGETLTLKLPYRPPLDWDALLAFLVGRGAAGVEAADGRRYLRGLHLGEQRGWIAAEPIEHEAALRVTVAESLLPVLPALLARLRALFDLDANPQAIREHLSADARLRRALARRPGLRVPGAIDGFELALRAVLGQRISVRAATTLFGRFAQRYGDPLRTPFAALERSGPRVERVAQDKPERIAALGLRQAQAHTVRALAGAVAEGRLRLTPDAPRDEMLAAFTALPGVGAWTAQYVAMRALRDADAFPASDLGVLRALGLRKPQEALARAEAWRPWRAYAAMHLWQEYGRQSSRG